MARRTKQPLDTAATAYREAVDEVPAAAKARAGAAKAAEGGATLRFANHRRPFDQLATLPAAQKKQLRHIATRNSAGPISRLADHEDWAPMELVDVIDIASGTTTHQLYVWPYGSGSLYASDTTTCVATVTQHTYQCSVGDLPLRTALAAAYATAEPKLSELVDFRLDHEQPARAQSELDYETAARRVERALGPSPDRFRRWDELTTAHRQLVRDLLGPLNHPYGVFSAGIPAPPAQRRWMELEPAGPYETRADDRPVWSWLTAAIAREVTTAQAATAVAAALGPREISDLCMDAVDQDSYALFARHGRHGIGHTHANDYVVRVCRLLAEVIDASGDDAATAFAQRAQAHLATQATFWLAATAVFAIATQARRRGEAFPDVYFALACACDFFGAGCSLRACDGYREIAAVMTPDQRQRLVGEITFGATLNTDIVNRREVQVPVLWGAWWFADLVPTAETATALVASIVRWDKRPKPVAQALAVIERVGAVCIPPLDAAIAVTPKPLQHKVLVAARELLGWGPHVRGED